MPAFQWVCFSWTDTERLVVGIDCGGKNQLGLKMCCWVRCASWKPWTVSSQEETRRVLPMVTRSCVICPVTSPLLSTLLSFLITHRHPGLFIVPQASHAWPSPGTFAHAVPTDWNALFSDTRMVSASPPQGLCSDVVSSLMLSLLSYLIQ